MPSPTTTVAVITRAVPLDKTRMGWESIGVWQMTDQDALLQLLGQLTEFSLEPPTTAELQLQSVFTGQRSEKRWLNDKSIKDGRQLLEYYSTQKTGHMPQDSKKVDPVHAFVCDLVYKAWPLALEDTQINNKTKTQERAVADIIHRLAEDSEQWN